MSDFSNEMKRRRRVRQQRADGSLKSSYTEEAVAREKARQNQEWIEGKAERAQYAALAQMRSRQRELDALATAKHTQVGSPLSAHYDPDYSRYTGVDTGVTDATYRWINDAGFRADVTRYSQQAATPDLPEAVGQQEQALTWLRQNGDPNYGTLIAANYDRMTQQERELYRYHYAKGGAEQANQFLQVIAGELNARKAAEDFEKIKGNTLVELASGIGAGFDQYARGLSGLVSKSEQPVSAAQYRSQLVREDLADNGPKLPEWLGGASVGQMAYDAVTTMSNMAPSILASTILSKVGMPGGTWIGSGTMGAGAAGNARQEALRAGYDDKQATAYGVLVGGAEMAMEKILGGISAFGKGGVGKIADKLSKGKVTQALMGLDNAFLQIAAKWGDSMLSEGSEEYVQELLDPVLRNLVLGEENELALYTPEAMYSGLLGALTGGLLEGPNAVVEGVAQAAEARVYNQGRENVQEAVQADAEDAATKLAELEVEDDVLSSAVAKKLWGQDLTRKEQAALESSPKGQQVLQQMMEQRLADDERAPESAAQVQQNEESAAPMQQNEESAAPVQQNEENAADIAAQEQAVPQDEAEAEKLQRIAEEAIARDDAAQQVQEKAAPALSEETDAAPEAAQDQPEQEDDAADQAAQALDAAREMGASGLSWSRVIASERAKGADLSELRSAWQGGRTSSDASAVALAADNAKPAAGGTARRKGAVKGQTGVDIAELTRTFNDPQKTAYKLLSFYAEVTGVDVVLYKGTPDQETGRFARGENTIYIDIDAGTNGWDATDLGAYTMMRTFTHEFVHFVEKWNPTAYNDLRAAVFEQMERNGSDTEELVALSMEETGLSFEQASREVVAEALTDILPESQFVQTLANKHKSLFDKLKERLEAFVTELKAHWKKLTGNNSREAVALKRQVGDALKYAEEIVQLFDRTAGEAVEAYQATVSEKETVREEPKPKKAEKPKAETEQTAEPEKPTEAPKQEEQAITDDRFTIEATKGGTVFVTFPGKPDADVRAVLKEQGFKWASKKKAWYAKDDPARVAKFLREALDGFPDLGDSETLRQKINDPAASERIGRMLEQANEISKEWDKKHGIFEGPVVEEAPAASAVQEQQKLTTGETPESVTKAAPDIEEDVNHGEHEAEAGGVLDHRADGTGDSGVLGDREAGAGAADDGGGDSVGVPAAGGREAVRHGSGADAQRSERGPDDGDPQNRVPELTDEVPVGELSEAVQELSERSAPREPDAGNWVIGDSLDLPQGDKARIRANLDAIAIVKRLEATGQRATAAEQSQLSKYVGWGGLDGIFNEYRKEHANEREELKKLLTDQEFRAARASTTTAFYTDIGIIRAVYDGLTALGFTGGRILEPAAGVGHFAGAMPAGVRQSVKSMTMVELDSITGAIAKHLYPGMDVRVEGFETTNLPNNYMDAAVGNVPFGNFGVVDKNYPKKIAGTIHNYFFAKTLDKVRPGGIVVMLTSRYTMDSNDSTAREYISKKADLLGAIRLPDNAFKSNAGTEVVSDILIFKKRAVGTPYAGADFVTGPKYAFGNNPYFDSHPEMVLGTIEQKHGRYGFGSTVKAREGDLGQQIREAFGKIEGRMDYPAIRDREHTNFAVERGARKSKNGGYSLRDGKLVRTENGQTVDHKLDEKTAKRVAGMVGIRDAARKLQNAQLQGQNPASIGKARKELNSLYDAFVKEYGYLNAPANKKAMQDDPDRYSILALENWDTDTRKATKSDIFSKNTVAPNRTVTSADTVEEGLIVSRNQTGGVDTDLIARLTGRSAEEVARELIDTRLAFKRADGTLEAAETYLSGNVRAKLREAEGLAPVDEDFHNNAEALRPLIPRDIPHTEIFVNPGATWVPAQLYGDFAAELLGGTNSEWRQDVKVTYHSQTGSYAVSLNSSYLKGNARNTQKYGTPRKPFHEILEAVLNSKSITVWDKVGDIRVVNEQATAAANEKAELLGEELRKWLWKDEARRMELTRLYNEQFNCLVNPKYDGSKLTFNGMNAAMQLRPHQLDAVARIISSGGNTLLAHRVGAGKTFEMAAAAMKLRELGLVKKPMFAVPKSLVAQWGKEFSDLFPAARLLVAEPGDFTADNRRTFANRIANGDYDAVIVSYEQFERLPISSDFATRLYQEQVDSIVDAIAEAKAEEGKRASVKDLERSRKTLENKIKKLADGAKDDDIRFEELGVDALFVDEAHNFKNLFYTTSMTNVAGLGNRDGSKRAFDLYTKVRYLQQLNGGKGIVFATATPVMNSMAEMYIMQRYLQPQMLHDLGIENFDAWAKQFGEVVNGLEVNPSGTGYRIKQSFSRFKNLPELQLLFRNMADVMTTVPGLKIPKMKGGKPIIVECEPGEYQQQYMKELAHRCETVKGKDPRVDNMLKITSDGRKIAYTQRMIDPSLPYEEGCKLYRCADNVLEVYKKTAKDSGTQMIFLDMATPKGKSSKEDGSTDEGMDMENAQLYDDLRQRLIEGGIPKKEIAFIHDADTDAKKKKLFQDVNEGKVRVLIGSTGKMGVGMNAQRRAVAIHHLDAPWRPGDVEQRNGRVFRQGNQNKEVSCYYYVTKGSYDARLWNKLDTKQHFVEQVMNGTDVGRDVEDTGEITLSAAEAMAVASGSPLIMEQVKLENEIKKLESLRRAHSQAAAEAVTGLAKNQAEAKQLEGWIEKAGQDLKRRTNTWQEKTFSVTIGKKVYKDRKDAGPALMKAAEKAAVESGYTTIGSFAGFDLRVVKTAEGIKAMLSGAQGYAFKTYPNNLSYMVKAMCDAAGGIEGAKQRWESRLERTREDIAEQKKLLDKPFDKEQQLQKTRSRYREVMAELAPKQEQRMDRLEAEDGDQKQVRRIALTDRQVLELFADEALPKDATSAERDAFAIHRKRLERLRTLEQDRTEAGRQYKENQFAPDGDRAKAQEAAKLMEQLDKAILKAADEVLSVEEAPVMRRVIQSARDAARRKQAQHDQNLLKEYRAKRTESEGQRKYRKAIQREVKTLREWLVNPDNKNALKHIPDVLKGPVGSFIAAIDLTSTNGGTQADEQMAKKMQAVLDAYKRHIDDVGGLYSGYADIPPDFVDRLTEMVNKTWQIAKSGSGTYKIRGGEMSAADLRELYHLIREMKRHITTVNRFHANAMFQFASDAAQDTMKHLGRMGKYQNTALDEADQFLFWKNVRPAYIWERFGKGGVAIYDGLRRGQAQLAWNTQAIKKFSDKAYSAEEVNAWEKEVKRVKLPSGGSIRLTVAQMMSLYCLSKREQALPHLLGGGIRGANIQGTDTEAKHLELEDIQAICDRLTKRQRAVADKLQKFMSEQGGEWGNAVTVKRFGERQFTEEHYFPISTDGQLRNAEADKPDGSDLYALLNMSFTKKLTPNANNRVMLYSVFDVFTNHMGAMAQYNAMALPVLDALKWFNYRETWKTTDGKPAQDSVREQMVKAFGSPVSKEGVKDGKGYAEQFVLNILRGYNGTEAQGTPNDSMGMKTLHRYNRAQVAYNMSVVLKQPLAILRAAQEIPYAAIARGLAASPAQRKADIAEMLKHSGIAAWKDLGFYDVNVSRGLSKIIKHNDTAIDKYVEKGMAGAEWADRQTWGAIWSACRHQCGGNLAKTTELFEQVIYKTQVVDSILTKTEYMRDKGFYSRLTSSFMSEPVTAVSPFLETAYRIKAEAGREGGSIQTAWRKHGGKLGRLTYVYGVTAVMTGVLQSLIDAWRDDDEYQTFGEKFLEVLGGNIGEELNPLEKLPVIKEIGTIFSAMVAKSRGEDVWLQLSTLPLGDVAEYTVDATEILMKKLQGKDTGYTWYGSIRKYLQAASGLTGIPLATPTREAVDIWNNIVGRMAPSLKVKTYEQKPADALRDAFLAGYVDEDEAVAKLMELGKAEDENEAYWKLRGWEGGSEWNKYDALAQAMAAWQSIDEAMDELTTHGVKEKTVRTQIRSIINDWLQNGAITEAEARSMLVKYGDRSSEEASGAVQEWKCETDTGVPYSGLKQAYLDGEITQLQAEQFYAKYGGHSQDQAKETVNEWRSEKETGVAYSDIVEAVLDGELSESEAARMYQEYGGMEQEDARESAHRLAFVRDNPECEGISKAAVADYEEFCETAGIKAKDFYDAWTRFNATNSIRDDGGKTVTSKREQVMAQIDAMNLTQAQKDSLYFAFGYAESKLWDTPWH